MAKTSFAKKASSTPAPARPAAGQKPPQKPSPAKNPAPARAPAAPQKTVVHGRPTPARPTPAAATRPVPAAASRPTPAAAARPAPARQTPATPAARVQQPAQRPAPAVQQRTPARPSPARPQRQPVADEGAVIDADAELVNAGIHGNAPDVDYTPESPEDLAYEAAAETAALAVSNQANLMSAPIGSISGELSTGDYAFPALKLAQALGPLTEEMGFTSGDIVFNDQSILWQEGCPEIEITILKVIKQFVEQTEMGEQSRIYNTLDEARADGLETEWGPNGEKPQVLPQALAMCLVKCPDGIDPIDFPVEHESGLFALGMWRISGASYKPLMQRITGAARTRLKEGLHTGSFLLSAKKVTGQFTYWVPLLNPGNAHEPEFVDFIVSQLQ